MGPDKKCLIQHAIWLFLKKSFDPLKKQDLPTKKKSEPKKKYRYPYEKESFFFINFYLQLFNYNQSTIFLLYIYFYDFIGYFS